MQPNDNWNLAIKPLVESIRMNTIQEIYKTVGSFQQKADIYFRIGNMSYDINLYRIFPGEVIKSPHLIPQHRLLTRKEWLWIQTPHRYSYWTTTGPIHRGDFIYTSHKEIFWVDSQTSRAIKHPDGKQIG